MTFGDTHMGQRVQLLDTDGEHWLSAVLLVEEPHGCHGGCCDALVLRGEYGKPVLLHARSDAEVRLAGGAA